MNARRRNLFLAAALVLALAIAAILLPARKAQAPLPPFLQLSQTSFPHQRLPFLIRLVPAIQRWSWFWRVRQKLFGNKRTVEIDVSVVECQASFNLFPVEISQRAFAGTNGLRAWSLAPHELTELRNSLKKSPTADFQFTGRATTSDGMGLGMYCGPGNYGFSMDSWPRLHGSSIDLLSSFKLTTAVTNDLGDGQVPAVSLLTNFESVVRMQITNGGGAFLMQTRSNTPPGKNTAILVSVSLPAMKK
jgi:hypothetical protein